MLLKNDAIEDIISIIKERKGHHIPIAMSFLTSYLVFLILIWLFTRCSSRFIDDIKEKSITLNFLFNLASTPNSSIKCYPHSMLFKHISGFTLLFGAKRVSFRTPYSLEFRCSYPLGQLFI